MYFDKFLKTPACAQHVKLPSNLLLQYLNLSLIIRFNGRYAMSISNFLSPKTVFKFVLFGQQRQDTVVKNGNKISTPFVNNYL